MISTVNFLGHILPVSPGPQYIEAKTGLDVLRERPMIDKRGKAGEASESLSRTLTAEKEKRKADRVWGCSAGLRKFG